MAPRLFACFHRAPSTDENAGATSDLSVEEQRKCSPVVVELFSSQGCTASQEAEVVATRLGRGDVVVTSEAPVVVVLAFHVDYWDYKGWKDPFGSSQWTVRQKAYVETLRLDTLYTPQVVVSGRKECLGTDEDAIVDALRVAPRFPAPSMQATFTKTSPTTLQVSFRGSLRSKIDSSGVDVMVALYESGLVTDCRGGENRGRTLANDSVVRRMNKLASVKDFGAKKTLKGSLQLELREGFNAGNCGMLLFVQNGAMHTFGAQLFQIPADITV